MTRLRRAAALVACLVTYDGAARAAEPPLSLEQVLTSVETNYPQLRAAVAGQAEATAGLLVAQGGFDPSLRASATVEPVSGYPKTYGNATVEVPTAIQGASLFGGYRIGRGDYAVYDQKLETNDHGEVRGGLRVPLLRDRAIDRRRAGLRGAELGADAARLSAAQQTIDARKAATVRYWDWVAAGARLEVVRDWLDLARKRDAALAARVQGGDAPVFERVENQRAIYQRETALAAAERDFVQAAVELSLFLRKTDGSPRVPTADERPPLPEPAAVDIAHGGAEALALSRSPEIQRIEIQSRRASIERELAGNQRLPGIDVIVAGSKDLGPGDPKRGLPVLEVTALVDIPILNRVGNGRADAADAALRRNHELLRLARDRAVADVRIALAGLDSSRTRVAATAQELAVARTLAEGELQRFQLGESNLLLVNLREQASAEASVRHVDVLGDFHRAVASLRAALARNGPHDRID